MLNKLNDMVRYCQLQSCRRQYLMNYFDEAFPPNCGSCDVCLTEFKRFDGTLIAQKALSAVARLNERFGINYVIDFLRGSKSEKIRDEHKHLKTYGIGADISKPDWQRYIRELLTMGYLQMGGDEYPIVKLTDQSAAVLKGLQKVEFIESETVEETHTHVQAPPHEAELLSRIKRVRNDIAQHENVPAYIIVSDATLVEMATYLPQSLDELRLISGFGDVKLARYGRELLQPVKDYAKEKGLESKIAYKSPKKERKAASVRPAQPVKARKTNDTRTESLRLYQTGKTVAEIAAERSLSPMTIESHLCFFVQSGQLEVEALVPAQKIPAIKDAVASYGSQMLSPLKQILGDNYSYGEIKAVISWMSRGSV
jgi:ATP-dependent DNA helicase RecQ